MTNTLTVASHTSPASYWEGGHYELNLSFDTLRDRQWERVMHTIWSHPAIFGPLTERFVPGVQAPPATDIHVPPPTATMTQHGQLMIGEMVIGCDVQATRSLFECISLLVPLGMFGGITGGPQIRRQHPELDTFDKVLTDIALRIYDVASFKIAAIGYERGCQLPAELRSNTELCAAFLLAGDALAQEDVLRSMQLNVADYEQRRANLRWIPSQTQDNS